MQAGFSRVDITPPVGTRLMGWGAPSQRLMTGAHDPLYARTLAVNDGQRDIVIVSLDLCFIGREDSLRMHGRIARELGLLPEQVMIAATHTHAGPDVGSYYEAISLPPQRDYLAQLDAAVVDSIRKAMAQYQEVRLKSTRSRTSLSLSRRPIDEQGKNSRGNSPNPGGPVQESMSLCLLESMTGEPVCLLYSIATHPVTFSGTQASADYIGVACDLLDKHLGRTCSLFLQGCAGDSRPITLQNGEAWLRQPGETQMNETGQILAHEVTQAMAGLKPAADGNVAGRLIEVNLPLDRPFPVAHYQQIAGDKNTIHAAWAKRQLKLIEQDRVATCAPLCLHAMQLGPAVQLIAIEGEPLHPYATMIDKLWPDGVTFPLGYVHGEGVYLVTTPMLAQGGYEPTSYWEYQYPSPLAQGMEDVIEQGLIKLRDAVTTDFCVTR